MVSGRTGYPARLRKIYEIPAARPKTHQSQGLAMARVPSIPRKKNLPQKKSINICRLADASLQDTWVESRCWCL